MERDKTTPEHRTIGELLAAGATWLEARRVEEPRLLCEWLAADLLSISRSELTRWAGQEADSAFVDRLREGVVRLGTGEPVQYVIGEWDFRCVTLKTDRRALIPRPETEELVQLVLDTPSIWEGPGPSIYDIGTGTGCIAISLAVERPSCRMTAVDIEEAALSLARENAIRCEVEDRIRFIHGSGCAGAPTASIDVIVSNPPYIGSKVVDGLPRLIRAFEPRSALDGGPDGLDIIRDLVHDAAIALRPGGWCFLEIGDDQGDALHAILEDDGFSEIRILPDFAGKTRYAIGRIA